MARSKQDFETLEAKFTTWVKARALHDPRYAGVLDVYNWAKKQHMGKRDNGEPEFIHPLRLALKVTSLTDRMEQARGGYMPDGLELIKAAICHDMLEDKNINHAQLGRKIGARAAKIVFNVSRKYIDHTGVRVRKSKEQDHADIRSDPAALLLKHIDRNDNLETMVDFTKGGIPFGVVYTPEKQKEKLHEAITVFLQASLEDRVGPRHGQQWVKPMNLVRHNLKLTISKVLQRNVHFEVMSEIDKKYRYRTVEMIRFFHFPKPYDKDSAPVPAPASGPHSRFN